MLGILGRHRIRLVIGDLRLLVQVVGMVDRRLLVQAVGMADLAEARLGFDLGFRIAGVTHVGASLPA